MLLVYLSTAWLCGIYLSARAGMPAWLCGLGALLPLSVAYLWRRAARVRSVALCALFVCLGALRYSLSLPHFDEHSVSTYNGRGPVTLTGIIAAEPDIRDTYINLRVRAESLTIQETGTLQVKGMVLVRAPRYPEPAYGDRIKVYGRLETPPVFAGFSYRDYLARKGIYSLVRRARIVTMERGQGNPFLSLLLTFKRHVQGVIVRILPEPCASLLIGILLGVESGIPQDLAEAFNVTGTSHIIAISGFNIAIVSGVVSGLGVRVVGRRYAACFATAAIALYTLFVGAGAAVVRAAVMGCIGIWGQHFGRQNSAPNALMATALLMTAWNPNVLWDLGFLLSFAATMGLILFADPFQRGFAAVMGVLFPSQLADWLTSFLNESLVLTTCAQLTTMPIILYNFGTLSLIALFANALILPAQTQVMLWGAAATVAGLAALPLGQVLGWVAWLFLAYTIWVVETAARVPHAAISIGDVHLAAVWGWYALLAGGAWLTSGPPDRREQVRRALRTLTGRLSTKLLIGGLAVAAILVWTAVIHLPDGRLHVTFLDVGEGDAVLIETPSGRHVLVDGGPSPTRITAHLGKSLPFWDRSLAMVVLSDDSPDHLAGLVPVVERYRVERLLQADIADCTRTLCERWRTTLAERQTVPIKPIAGTRVDLGDGVSLTVLHPPRNEGGAVVMRVDYGGTCVLLAAGAGQEEERAMLARREELRCDILQVGLNGDRRATGTAFLEAVRPTLAVISCGEGNRSGHPDAETLKRLGERGIAVLRTDRDGSVEIIGDGEGYHVRIRR